MKGLETQTRRGVAGRVGMVVLLACQAPLKFAGEIVPVWQNGQSSPNLAVCPALLPNRYPVEQPATN